MSNVPLIHIIPYNDKLMHRAHDTCFCHPVIRNGKLVHNAKDCREAKERHTGKTTPGKGWVEVEQIL